jgi:cob(I)alamin adenosyltransferase
VTEREQHDGGQQTGVVLSRIYTKTGDDGTTALGDMSRASKTDPRVVAYGAVDETNAAIGTALALGNLDDDIATLLKRIQNDLFDVGADLCTPVVTNPEYPPLRVTDDDVSRLEAACDLYNARVEKLRSFVLPGGTPAAALLHVARTVTRRAERNTWEAIDRYGIEGDGSVNPIAARYLNRLSDLLFILSRCANVENGGDVLWQPGASRS